MKMRRIWKKRKFKFFMGEKDNMNENIFFYKLFYIDFE